MNESQDGTIIRTNASEIGQPAVIMRSIVKMFGTLTAIARVDFDVNYGEIHALLGENGAGKSTLMNMLYGLLKPDEGQILVDTNEVSFGSPQDAKKAGIGMVHQHYKLVPTLNALENVILGDKESLTLSKSYMDRVRSRIQELETQYNLTLNKDVPVWQLSVGEQQRLEILRALYHNSRILILDEPTSMLTPTEIDQLLPRLRTMADSGAAIIIITHHLDEVMACADRITVLRGGENVASVLRSDTDIGHLARLMVGHDVSTDGAEFAALGHVEDRSQSDSPQKNDVLKVSDLVTMGDHAELAVSGVSFEVAAGEIVAIAGVAGNGQTELEEVLFGLRTPSTGQIQMHGQDITNLKPKARLEKGIGLIPSDRYLHGLIKNLSVSNNLILDRIHDAPIGRMWRLDFKAISQLVEKLIERFDIRIKSEKQLAGTLSGGNAQRLVLARSLSRDIKLLIAAQPARGLDVGAVVFVWKQIQAAKERGQAVLLISTELEEILALADRCYVMYRGQFVGQWQRGEMTRESIGLAMGGATPSHVENAA